MTETFDEVYREHVTPIWRYVRVRVPSDADAEDVCSDVFANATASWDRFDPGRGSVGGWLVGIARHTIADWWRKRGWEVPVEEITDRTDPDADPESWTLRLDGVDDLRRHLGILSAREREAIALRFGTELTSDQIGEVLGISAPAARMLVYRAVGKLREVMTR